MTRKLMIFCLGLVACLSVAGCVSATDQELPYTVLPEITVATEFRLTASPSHPTAYLPVDPITSGTHVQIVGRDKNAAWLLVLHNNILGWMPTFYSRDNLGILSTAFTVEPLSDKCTAFLDALCANIR